MLHYFLNQFIKSSIQKYILLRFRDNHRIEERFKNLNQKNKMKYIYNSNLPI